MRFLKNKIANARKTFKENLDSQHLQDFLKSEEHAENQLHNLDINQNGKSNSKDQFHENEDMLDMSDSSTPKKRRCIKGQYVTSEKTRAMKNIVKNYGKAICSFASSDLAVPYLENILINQGIYLKDFVSFITNIKEDIHSIQSLRNILEIFEDDNKNLVSFKKVFAHIAEIFIKYFSVNWIFSGKLRHKETYLKFRFKMLRRIKHPESFTYIQKTTRRRKN